MIQPGPYLWLIPLLPLTGAAVILVFGRFLGKQSHWPCLIGAAGSCVIAMVTLVAVAQGFGAGGDGWQHS